MNIHVLFPHFHQNLMWFLVLIWIQHVICYMYDVKISWAKHGLWIKDLINIVTHRNSSVGRAYELFTET